MALEGTLADFNVFQIFQQIGQGQKTGILTIYSGQDTTTVSFQNGLIVAASSSHKRPEDKLGSFLVKKNYIDEGTLQKALLDQSETFDRLGQILIKKRLIDKTALQQALRDQMVTVVSRLFSLEKGFYHFKVEEKVHYDEENVLPMPVENVLMAGVEQTDEAEKLAATIPSDMVFQKAELAEEFIKQDLKALGDLLSRGAGVRSSRQKGPASPLSSFEKQLLGKIDGAKSVAEVSALMGLPEPEIVKALTKLQDEGYILAAGRESEPRVATAMADDDDFGTLPEDFIERPPLISYVPFLILPLLLSGIYLLGMNPIKPFLSSKGSRVSVFQISLAEISLQKSLLATQIFYANNQRLPDVVDDLVSGSFLEGSEIVDPWGNKLVMVPDREQKSLVIISRGPDGNYGNLDDIRLEHSFTNPGDVPTAFFPGVVSFPK